MLKKGGRLVAVGDPNQAIYGFSGADNDSLEQIKRDFDAETLPLSVTYRCPKEVVRLAQQYVAGIEAHDTNAEGEVLPLKYDDLVKTVKVGDAVLCRYNKYLVNLAFRLIRNGVPARIEGRAIGAGLVALASKWKVKDLDSLRGRVEGWMSRETKKALAKGNDSKAMQIEDRGETLLVLIDRAEEQQFHTVVELRRMIEGIFDDRVVHARDMVTLCSVHRSKGMEWKRVFLLGREELMGRECRQYWQTQQEINLIYVAVTRAQSTLFDVYGVKEENK
jgi:superfamily I DNA/RNA helicase